MGYALLIGVILFITLLLIGSSKSNKGDNKNVIFAKCNYCGGYEEKLDMVSIWILVNKKREFYIQFQDGKKMFMLDDIKNITTKSETEMSKEVTLGRFLLVGILALAWKKNKIQNRKFLIITYYDRSEDVNRDIILEMDNAGEIYLKLKNILNNEELAIESV